LVHHEGGGWLALILGPLRRLARYYLTRHRELIHAEVNRILEDDATDLGRVRRRLAAESTARFIDESLSTVQSTDSASALLRTSIQAAQVDRGGLVLEFGVFEGGSINLIADLVGPSVTVFGFDSFEGLPEGWIDGFGQGRFAIDGPPLVKSNVHLVKGWFAETLPPFLQSEHRPVAFLHVDCDLYSSTRVVLHHLAPRLKPGTVIVFDEYFNYPGWERGEFLALQEITGENGLLFDYIGFNRRGQQVAIRVR
jgi:hypothetical protein